MTQLAVMQGTSMPSRVLVNSLNAIFIDIFC